MLPVRHALPVINHKSQFFRTVNQSEKVVKILAQLFSKVLIQNRSSVFSAHSLRIDEKLPLLKKVAETVMSQIFQNQKLFGELPVDLESIHIDIRALCRVQVNKRWLVTLRSEQLIVRKLFQGMSCLFENKPKKLSRLLHQLLVLRVLRSNISIRIRSHTETIRQLSQVPQIHSFTHHRLHVLNTPIKPHTKSVNLQSIQLLLIVQNSLQVIIYLITLIVKSIQSKKLVSPVRNLSWLVNKVINLWKNTVQEIVNFLYLTSTGSHIFFKNFLIFNFLKYII